MSRHAVLVVLAIVFFVLAAFPKITGSSPVRWEWLAFACLTATLIA